MPDPREPRFGPAWLEARLASLSPDTPFGWCVAWSGGADSTALLAALVALRDAATAAGRRPLPLRAIHVDHRLQPAAQAFRRHCRQLARRWKLPLTVQHVVVDATPGRSLEEAAREARYAALAAALRPGEALLLAQHAGDQLETFFLQALRGAGVAGLASMPGRASFGAGRLLRPLLPLERPVLLDYLQSRGIAWVEDPSNLDPRHDRNYLRHAVLPALLDRWPSAARTVARSARHAALADVELQDRGARDAAAAADGPDLDIRVLRCLPARRLPLALRAWITHRGLPLPDERGLGEVLRLLEARGDAQPCVRWADVEIRRHGGRLVARRQPGSAPDGAAAREPRDWRWSPGRPLRLAGGGSLVVQRDPWGDIDIGRLPAVLRILWRGEAGVRPAGCDLKSLLRESGIPSWERAAVPLLFAGDQLLAVADLWHDASLQASESRVDRGRFVWRRG